MGVLTDQNILNEIQFSLNEVPNNGASFSALWTIQEVLNYLNQRQFDFLKQTGIVLTRNSVATIPNENRQPLPNDWIATQRVAWQSADSPAVFTEIPRTDGFEMDHGLPSWPYQMTQIPTGYTDGETPNLEMQVMPAANTPGTLWVLYVALSATFTGVGVAFAVPDEFVESIKWGVIADMLAKAGRAHDPLRAQVAESHYQEGIEAAKIILAGWP